MRVYECFPFIWPYNARSVEVGSPNSPEVGFWSITLARSFCGTCPRSRFRANVTSECCSEPVDSEEPAATKHLRSEFFAREGQESEYRPHHAEHLGMSG